LAVRLREATAKARASWVMFLKPGVVLDATWIDEVDRFVQQAEAHGVIDAPAAAFRAVAAQGFARPLLAEAWSSLRLALGGRIAPEQGLIIPKVLYERLGRHRDVQDPEADLLARLGRRRIVLLRSRAWASNQSRCWTTWKIKRTFTACRFTAARTLLRCCCHPIAQLTRCLRCRTCRTRTYCR